MNKNDILTFIIAAGGWLVVILQTIMGFLERKKKQDDDIFLKTMDYFTGGSQKRSVGISIIEGLLKKKQSYDKIIVPLLANQFVYLLLSSNLDSAVHEERNLVRIFMLLKEIILSDKDTHWHSRNEVLDAISRRLDNDEKSTINIANSTLQIWQRELEK